MEPPSLRAIADLFAVPDADVNIREPKRKKKGDSADESDALGRQSLTDGDYEAAIAHFQRAVEQRGADDISSRIDLAGAYDYSDQYPQALRQYEKALRVKSDAAEPHVGISDLYRRYGRYRDSIEELEAATRLEPDNAFYHMKLAETLREAGAPRQSLIAVQGAIRAKPDEAYYHYWMGDVLLLVGQVDEALDAFRAAIELSPGDDFLYLRAAVAFWLAGRRPEAIKSLRLASDLDPAKNLYHGVIESLLVEMGQSEEALLERPRAEQMDCYDEDMLDRLLAEMKLTG